MGLLIATSGSFTGGTCNNGSMFCESLARLVTGSTRHAGQLVYPAYSSPTMRAYDLPTSELLMFLPVYGVPQDEAASSHVVIRQKQSSS